MDLKVRRWRGPDRTSHRPGIAALGLDLGQPSVGFRRLACKLGTFGKSFDRTARNLADVGVARVSPEKLRQVIEGEGRQVQQAHQDQAFDLNWRAGEEGLGQAQTPLCLGVDGAMTQQVTDQEKRQRRRRTAAKRAARARHHPDARPLPPLPPRKQGVESPWKEVKVVGTYGCDHQRRHWRATHQDHRMAGILMGQAIRRVKLGRDHVVIAVVDGAAWIVKRLREMVPHLKVVILDYYHLSEHVYAAGRSVFGEGDEAGKAWAQDLLTRILERGFEAFDTQLSRSLERHGDHQALKDLQRYVRHRREMVDYPRYREAGWPIGSGPTESMAGVLTERVKHGSSRWDGDNVEAMMALAALEVSEEEQAYWACQRKKAA